MNANTKSILGNAASDSFAKVDDTSFFKKDEV